MEVARLFWNWISEQRWDALETLLAPEFVAEWPQSRERMVGAKNFVAVNRHYPGNHRVEWIRGDALSDSRFVTTVWIEADTGQRTFATSYFWLNDGKITRLEEYWAEPYPAPAWRAEWVEKF